MSRRLLLCPNRQIDRHEGHEVRAEGREPEVHPFLRAFRGLRGSMSGSGLYALLVASLAVNAGVLAVFGLRRYRAYRIEQHLVRTWVRDRAALRQLDQLLEASHVVQESLREEKSRARRELGQLGLERNPDSEAVEAALDRLEELSRRQWYATIDLERAFGRLLRPEVHSRLVANELRWADSVEAADSAAGRLSKEER